MKNEKVLLFLGDWRRRYFFCSSGAIFCILLLEF